MAITTPYKNNTVSSVSGTTFNSNGTPFAAGDVGRLIIMKDGSAKLQHRLITGYTDTNTVTVAHAWDTNPFLDSVDDVAPAASDSWVMSYIDTDSTFTSDSGVTASGNDILFGTFQISGDAYVLITNKQIQLDAGTMEVSKGGGLIFGYYVYVAGEDGEPIDPCHIRDVSNVFTNNDWRNSSNQIGMVDMYGCTVDGGNGGNGGFWRFYEGTNGGTSLGDVQARLIGLSLYGDPGLGMRIDGTRSILTMKAVGTSSNVGIASPLTATSRVEISAIDGTQSAYLHTLYGPEGRAILPRLANISSRVLYVNATVNPSTSKVFEIIAKKSEIDLAPVFMNANATASNHQVRYGNFVEPSYIKADGTLLTDSIKTALIDDTPTTVNSETITTGLYTKYFARHTDLDTVSGNQDLSDGTLYAPYTLNSISWLYDINSAVVSCEDTFQSQLVMLIDALLTQTNQTTVGAYTTIDDAYELYDRAKDYLYDNFADEGETIISRSVAQAVLADVDLIINATAGSAFAFATNTITVKSTTFTGGATATTGDVTLQNGALLSGGTFNCDVNIDNNSDADTYTNVTIDKLIHTGTGARTLTIDGGTITELEVTGGVALTVTLLNGASVTTETETSGTITLLNPVTVKVTVTDAAGSPIQNARVYLEAGATGPATQGDVLLTGLTNASGIVQDTAYDYQGDQSLQNSKARKGTASTYYSPATIAGTIGSNGLDVNVIMIEDE